MNMFKHLLLSLGLLFCATALSAQIDTVFLHTLSGTKWELTKQTSTGKHARHQKNELRKETIQFSDNEILFDQPDVHLSCTYTIEQNKALILSCAVPAQTKYSLRKLSRSEMELDVYQLRKTKTGTEYVRTLRVTYKRIG
jgi:hypothetical protein